MPTREQLVQERFDALARLICESNEAPAGELPSAEYVDRLRRTREFREADKYCEYCKKAGEYLEEYNDD